MRTTNLSISLEWGDWFNHRRILEPIGDRPPAEAEAAYCRQTERSAIARDAHKTASGTPGAVQWNSAKT